jgi:hypothetical protein
VRCFSREGSETRVRWPAVPARITPDEIAEWVEQGITRYAAMMGGEARARDVLSSLNLPESRPFLTDLQIDEVGNIWVELPSAINSDEGSKLFRVFDETGSWVTQVRVPCEVVLEIGPNYVLGVTRDEFDVEYVELFPITK